MTQIRYASLFVLSIACGKDPQVRVDAHIAGVDAVIDAVLDAVVDAQVDPCTEAQVSIDDFFTCLSQATCRHYEDCNASDTADLNCDDVPIGIFGNLDPAPLKQLIHDVVTSGRAQWDPTAARACLGLLNANDCGLFKNGGNVFATCAAIVGNVNTGQPCQNDIECATPGARCIGTGSDPCVGYTCRAPVPTGQMCINGAFCLPGDHCVRRVVGADTSFCSAGAANEACDRHADCDRGLYCNGGLGNGTAAGICTAAKAANAICNVDEECAGELACVGNIGATTGVCLNVRAAGTMCDLGGCYGHQYCDAQATAVGTCKPAPQLDAACGPVAGTPSFCGFFMSCELGVCRAPGNVGEACTSSGSDPDGCNVGVFCDKDLTMTTSGFCLAPQTNNSQCRPNNTTQTTGVSRMCASGWCSNNACTDFPTCNL